MEDFEKIQKLIKPLLIWRSIKFEMLSTIYQTMLDLQTGGATDLTILFADL